MFKQLQILSSDVKSQLRQKVDLDMGNTQASGKEEAEWDGCTDYQLMDYDLKQPRR